MSEVDTTETNIASEDDLVEEDTPRIPVIQQLSLLAVILVLIFGSALSPSTVKKYFDTSDTLTASPAQTKKQILSENIVEENSIEPFSEIILTAKSAYVWDIHNQRVLFKKSEDEKLPLASVTKLMTALVAEELLTENENVWIDETAIRQDGDSGLLEGEVFDRLTLTDLVLMSSSNDGAFALAKTAGSVLSSTDPANAFVQAMNVRAEEIGLHETSFKNATGLDISITEAGSHGTARDMAFLMEYIVKNNPDLLTYTQESEALLFSQSGEMHDAENTNYYIHEIPGLIGSKTGYTDLAGGNLVVAFDAGFNRPIIVSVLGSTRQERFTDTLTLVEETQRYIANE